MLIAIHRGADSQDGYVNGWAECLAARGVDIRWVDLTAWDALHQVQGCNGVMWHWGLPTKDDKVFRILTAIELYLGIPVFPNHYSSWHRRNKLAQYCLFQAAAVPMPETWVFWDKQQAKDWAVQTDYPKVLKLSAGRGGTDVALVSSSGEACRLIDYMFGPGIYSGQIDQCVAVSMPRNWPQVRTLASRCKAAARYVLHRAPPNSQRLEKGYVYFQEFVPGNDYKIGITVIGDRAFASRSFNGKDDFRSHRKKTDYELSKIDIKCVQMAFNISERLGFYFMGYDFLFHHGEPVVLEMYLNDRKTCGYWKRNLEWVNEPISPQEAQVETFLSSIRSRRGKLRTTLGPRLAEHGSFKMEL